MFYRKELDGLRAIAVISVVLYHAGVPILSGGFVGVDIFFVLSGFLITTIIFKQVNTGNFTYSDFYWRRFRRILPALFFMIIAVAVAGYGFMDPLLYEDFGISAFYTALFSSNIFFWTEAGYFQKAAELKPLLHTWSLSIEEQYYLFFPVLMIWIKKHTSNKFIFILSIVGGLSLLLSIIGVYYKPVASFYLLPTRLWELLIGSLLAVYASQPSESNTNVKWLSWLGIILMVVPLFTYTKYTLFPGVAAILPCLGTALIIWSLNNNKNTLLKRLLSIRPVTFIGKISYSFYLWHWPILILTEYYTIEDLTLLNKLTALLISFFIAWFSWRFVEKPFRENHQLFPKKRMLTLSFISIALISVVGLLFSVLEGIPTRFDLDIKKIIAASSDKSVYFSQKCSRLSFNDLDPQLCTLGSKTKPPTFLLWGDSHTGAIAPAFDISAKQLNISGTLAFWAGCPPLLNVQRIYNKQRGNCLKDRDVIKHFLFSNPQVTTVILSARWGAYVEKSKYKNEKNTEGVTVFYKNIMVDDNDKMVKEALDETVNWLKTLNKKVIIVMPTPEIGVNVPSMLAKLAIREATLDIRPTKNEYMKRQFAFFKIAKDIANKYDTHLIYPHKNLCNEQYCDVMRNNRPLYFDDDHLSVYGAMQIMPIVQQSF